MNEAVETRIQRVRDTQREAERGLDQPLELQVIPDGDWSYPGMCPAQWEGTTTDGCEVYVKYRDGHLKVWVADELVFSRDFERPGHGEMTREDMLTHTGISIVGAP